MSERSPNDEARLLSPEHSSLPAFLRRHVPLFLLLPALAAFSFRTVNTYLLSDDLKWVERTVADAARPWNAFGAPLFQDYFRPVPHLVWIVNYWLWGFNFAGHHVMYLAAWLGVVALVYAVGCRMGGRVAGMIAAAIVGFNDVYLLMASWKSWYTSILELLAVLGWAWFYLGWLHHRRRRDFAAWLVLAGVATISRELAPLVISACVFVTAVLPAFGRGADGARDLRRGGAGFSIWLVATLAALALLPSYRHAAFALVRSGAEVGASVSAQADVSFSYLSDRLHTHTHSMLNFGIARYLVLFAILHGLARRFNWRNRFGKRFGPTFLGMLVIGTVILALPAGLQWHAESRGALLASEARFCMDVILLAAFVVAGLAGGRKERFIAVWFAVAYAPPMVLRHASNAYHMLAFIALAVAVGNALGRFASDEMVPALRRLSGREKSMPGEEWRTVTVTLVTALIVWQAAFLDRNMKLVTPVIRDRIKSGAQWRAEVEAAVDGVLKDSAETREVWAAKGGYARIAALMLQEEHGFTTHLLPKDRRVVGLRTFGSPLPVYSETIVYEDALFSRYNAFPNPGFEQAMPGGALSDHARSGRRALQVRAEGDASRPVTRSLDSSPFGLRPGMGYVFGGFLMKAEGACDSLCMALGSARGDTYRVRTPSYGGRDGEWGLAWACASPPAEAGNLILSVIVVEGLAAGTVYADDVFLCPVEPLMDEAREGRRRDGSR